MPPKKGIILAKNLEKLTLIKYLMIEMDDTFFVLSFMAVSYN